MKTALTLVIASAVLMLCSCSNPKLVRVKQYQRGHLANRLMLPDREPLLLAMLQHSYFSRESTFGGGGVGGGGCGCN